MSKNAKKALKAIMEKHKDDIPVRPKKSNLKKPACVMVPLLELDDCMSYAVQEDILTDADCTAILEYMKGISDESGYWDMHWGDIEEENGMKSETAKKFRAFYEMFKEHEIKGEYPHLHFDVGVYT